MLRSSRFAAMGYNVYIRTRARDWADNRDHEISRDEWLAAVDADPDLSRDGRDGTAARWRDTWFDWQGGNAFTKNPTEAAIRKMVGLGASLGAHVQGDDGETYNADAVPIRPAPPSLTLRDRLLNIRNALAWTFWNRWRVRCPFRVGDRVRNAGGLEGVVVAVDRAAEHGAGTVTVRFDDGRVLTSLLIAPGIETLQRDPP